MYQNVFVRGENSLSSADQVFNHATYVKLQMVMSLSPDLSFIHGLWFWDGES